MKFTKLSLVAALAISSAFAGGDIAPVEPVVEAAPVVSESTITGNVKLWYGTNDAGLNSLFSKNGAFGDAYADVKYSREVMENVTLNVGMAYITTLGLEKDLVSATWINHGAVNPVADVAWLNEANVVIGLPSISSFVKVGRQELDTPFFYSEKWSIATNTFDAAVAGTTALPDTTLIAAWVGRGNGAAGAGTGNVNLTNANFGGGHVGFSPAGSNPAYAFAAINKSITDTALQAWFYKIPGVADAYWLQADTKVSGIDFGAQYAATKLLGNAAVAGGITNKTSAYAFKLGYSSDALSAYVAYSDRDNTAGIDISNIATGHTVNSQSKLYTESYWNYGYVGAQDAQSIALGASYDLGMAKLGAQYTNVNGIVGGTRDLSEFALTASTKVGPINADLAYVNSKNGLASSNNTVLVMLTMPFSL